MFSDEFESDVEKGRRRIEEGLRAIEVQNSILMDEVQRGNRLIQLAISSGENAKFNSAIA
jgi:hypothetical protein